MVHDTTEHGKFSIRNQTLNRYQVDALITKRLSQAFLTQKTNTSMSREIEAPLTATSSTGARETPTNMTEPQPEHSRNSTIHVGNVDLNSTMKNGCIYTTLMATITTGSLVI
jgi:hypothetical protein